MMKKFAQIILIGFGLSVILTQFNNCGSYSAYQATGVDSLNCITANCVTLAPANLKITPHIYNGQYPVTATTGSFDIGGDCNEGGYVNSNVVHWDLMLNGVTVRQSSNPDITGSTNAESMCINGRFLVYVNLGYINSDPVDRTGLSIGTVNGTVAYAPYNLKIVIWGLAVINGNTVPTLPSSALVPLTVF